MKRLLRKRFHERYLPHYRHARKLFVFDLLLLTTTIILIILSLVWFFYDPRIVDDIDLRIQVSQSNDKIACGEDTDVIVTYTNTSDIAITNTVLRLLGADGFIANTSSLTYQLGTIEPNQTGSVTLDGTLFANINDTVPFRAVLQYNQIDSSLPEQVVASQLVTIRQGAVDITDLSVPQTVVAGASLPISFTLTPHTTYEGPVVIAFDNTDSFTFNVATTTITVAGDTTVTGTLLVGANPQTTNNPVTLQALVQANDVAFIQDSLDLPLTVIAPRIQARATWTKETGTMGSTQPLSVTIENDSAFPMIAPQILVPAHPYLSSVQSAIRSGEVFIFDTDIESLAPGASQTVTLPLQLAPTITDVNPRLSLPLRMTAALSVAPNTRFESQTQTNVLRIAGRITGGADARYFTNEGDQLGRGPLPPRANRETKYWAMVSLRNVATDKRSIEGSITLPAGVTYTGRKSLSHGQDITQSGNTLTWSLPFLAANDTVYIGLELSTIPTEAQIGQFLPLLAGGTFNATDTHTGSAVSANINAVDSSIVNDPVAQTYGTRVEAALPVFQ